MDWIVLYVQVHTVRCYFLHRFLEFVQQNTKKSKKCKKYKQNKKRGWKQIQDYKQTRPSCTFKKNIKQFNTKFIYFWALFNCDFFLGLLHKIVAGSGCRRFWQFTKLFLDTLAELISQKLLLLEEQLFTVICNLTVIWYNPTYAFKKPPKKHSEWIFSFNFHYFSLFFVSGSIEASNIMHCICLFSKN
jgi:hypothetical protein